MFYMSNLVAYNRLKKQNYIAFKAVLLLLIYLFSNSPLRQGLQAVPRTPEDPVTAPLYFELAAAQKKQKHTSTLMHHCF